MERKGSIARLLSGILAGSANGLFGAGGGMILVPMLSKFGQLEEKAVFPTSVCIIFPICIVSLCLQPIHLPQNWWVYLVGSAAGGIMAGLFGKKIPTKWLHRFLGILILYGGIRYLC